MPTKTQRIIGWTLTVLVGLFLIGASGVPKFLDISKIPDMADMLAKLQIPLELLKIVGAIEISVAVLYLIPRTAFLGAILTTGYLGGAVWTHLRVGDAWFFPIIVAVLMWLGLALRRPVIFRLLLGQESPVPPINDAAQR
jgi:DoxX-like protein